MGVLARGQATWGGSSVTWMFTNRVTGSSAPPFDAANLAGHVGDDPVSVRANRSRLAADLHVDPDSVIAMTQVHGRTVIDVTGPHDGDREGDALVTTTPGLALMTQEADCVPILLGAPGVVAAVHAGWRGVVAGVVPAAVDRMLDLGVEAEQMRAWVGPAICPGCYEVGPDVRDEVAGAAGAAFAHTRTGTPAVDVRAGVVEQLARLGVDAEVIGGCTFEDPELYSFRRDQVTGRQAGVIVMRVS